jgi:hypothetical protein
MKTHYVRTMIFATTAALLVLPASAGGLLGGGSLGGNLGGTLGSSMGGLTGSGTAAGNGQGAFGSDLGSRLEQTRSRTTERASGVAGKATNKVKAVSERVQDKTTAATQAARDSDPAIAGSGALGGNAVAETAQHEVLLGGEGGGAAKADRSGVDASLTPDASAKAGRKPAPVTPETQPN